MIYINLFNIISADFFKPLSNKYKTIYIDCMGMIYNSYKSELSYGVDKDVILTALEHLINKTGVDFKSFKMDIETLKTYAKYTKSLTPNDRVRLQKLVHSKYGIVINYMLKNNCKLEQEAINLK